MTKQKSALDFFAEALSEAEKKFTPEKFKHLLDEIFAAAQCDPTAEIVLVFRKGGQVALVGMKQGRMIEARSGFANILRPIVQKL